MPGTGLWFRCHVISAITNRGQRAFMVFTESFTGAVCLRFLWCLLCHARRKVCWIADRHPAPRAAVVTRWLHRHRERVEHLFLPAYSPELTPR